MESVKQWAFSVCAAMVACGLAQMLLPRAGMEKIFRTTVSVFFLCCLLSPVVFRMPELRIEVRESAQADIDWRAQRLSDEVVRQTDTAARRELADIVEEKLVQMGIKYVDITINMNVNGQSGQEPEASVSPESREVDPQVSVLLSAAHEGEQDAVREALERQLGLAVQVACEKSQEEGAVLRWEP